MHLVWQIQIAKEFLITNHPFFRMNCAFSLTKKTIPHHGVTYVQLFGRSKRTPIFERKNFFLNFFLAKISLDDFTSNNSSSNVCYSLGLCPKPRSFQGIWEYRKSQRKKPAVTLAFPSIHLKYSFSSCASTELESAFLRLCTIQRETVNIKQLQGRAFFCQT